MAKHIVIESCSDCPFKKIHLSSVYEIYEGTSCLKNDGIFARELESHTITTHPDCPLDDYTELSNLKDRLARVYEKLDPEIVKELRQSDD